MDEVDFLASLPSTPNYSKKDRYSDFRRVFTGSEEGRRVMREILSWGRMFRPGVLGTPIDPYLMAMREGERNIALHLLDTVHNEPPEPPAKQKR